MTVHLPSGRRQLAVMWEKERTTQCQAPIFQLSVSGETGPICARGMFHWPRNTVLDLSTQKKAGSNCYSLYPSGCNKPSVGRVIGRFRNISKHPSPVLKLSRVEETTSGKIFQYAVPMVWRRGNTVSVYLCHRVGSLRCGQLSSAEAMIIRRRGAGYTHGENLEKQNVTAPNSTPRVQRETTMRDLAVALLPEDLSSRSCTMTSGRRGSHS